MPALIVLGIVAAYGGIGLVMRAKFYPREPVRMALAWPLSRGLDGSNATDSA